MNVLFTTWQNYGGRIEPVHSEFFFCRLYFSVRALCTVPINNNKKCDPSALNDTVGWEESRGQKFKIPIIYSCRLEWIKMAHWEQVIYPKEEC
jgi:hypothetical protein